jgi:hypothetical protein
LFIRYKKGVSANKEVAMEQSNLANEIIKAIILALIAVKSFFSGTLSP